MKYKYITACHSATGALKDKGKINEDSYFVESLDYRNEKVSGTSYLIGVCDGVGGLSKGDVASSFVRDEFVSWFKEEGESLLALCKKDLAGALLKKTVEVNKKLYSKGKGKMASTLSLIYFKKNGYVAVQVGDSRAYLMQGKDGIQVTKDQTVLQKEIDEGKIREEDADPKDRKMHTLLQAMGAEKSVKPDVYIGRMANEFSFFLCTDGCVNRVSNKEIIDTVTDAAYESEKEKIVAIMKRAIGRGEKDNVTGIIVKRSSGSIESKPEKIEPPEKL